MPTYNEDLYDDLTSHQRSVNKAMNDLRQWESVGGDLTTSAQTALKATIKALSFPSSLTTALSEWDGVPTP